MTRLLSLGLGLALLAALVGVSGCAHSNPPSAVVRSDQEEARRLPPASEPYQDGASEASDSFPGASKPMASTRPGRRMASGREVRKSPPGLATQWGERRRSELYEVDFRRQAPERPLALVSFRYDDAAGIGRLSGLPEPEVEAQPSVVPIAGGAVTVALVGADEEPLPLLFANGTCYVLGDEGERYAISIRNHTAERFEVVASVDGLDVLDGSDAAFHQRGYVVQPWGTLTIEGFRDSASTVRAFRFGEVWSSYAVGRGRGRDVGVVGVALFDEVGSFRGGWGGYGEEPEPFPGRFAPPPRR